jgi:cold shock protein
VVQDFENYLAYAAQSGGTFAWRVGHLRPEQLPCYPPCVSPAAWNSLTIIPPHFRVGAFHTLPGNHVSSRDRDFRPTRRRSFDDDNFEAPRRSFGSTPQFGAQRFEAPSGPPVQAVVKWYNPEKGFGFVQLADGSGDAFLHVSVVERSGHDRVPPGATLEVRAGPGPKGPQITEILSVDSSTAQQESLGRARPERPVYPLADQAAVEESGTVKWYNAMKGFGFIASDRGGKDIFVHASALERAGITGLTEGQRVSVDVIDGRKGPEAAGLRLI